MRDRFRDPAARAARPGAETMEARALMAAGGLGLNTGIEYVDVMKQVPDWVPVPGHGPLTRDADGWPTSDAEIVALDDSAALSPVQLIIRAVSASASLGPVGTPASGQGSGTVSAAAVVGAGVSSPAKPAAVRRAPASPLAAAAPRPRPNTAAPSQTRPPGQGGSIFPG